MCIRDRPKGVMIEHRAAFNFISGMNRRLTGVAGRHWLFVTSTSFDIALYEWLGCLSNGDPCVIASAEEQHDPLRLADLLARYDFGLLQTTPSRWIQLLETGWKASGSPLALCGGEALSAKLQGDLCAAGVRLWNCYGPTEATVWSLVNAIDPDSPQSVSYTHLDVYKRQSIRWRPCRKASCSITCWSCLLYTSRCV